MPTESGYRYYVESIVDSVPLPPVEQLMIRHQFGQVEYASEHWFRLAATTLASVTRAAGLATPAKPTSAHLRRLDLVSISDRMASLILVLREGSLKQVLISLDEPTDAGGAVARGRAPERAARGPHGGGGRAGAGRAAAPATPRRTSLARVGERVVRALQEFDAAAIEELFSDGLLNVMAAPEFAHSEKLRRVFAALENRAYLAHLIAGVAGSDTVRVYIGSENPAEEMADVSLVLAPYGRPGRGVGVVGVLGPTRMAYPQAIGTVRFVSGLMNELIDHLYA